MGEYRVSRDERGLSSKSSSPNRTRLISFAEFQAFEALLCQPDSIYKAAFHLFDKNSSGHITYDEFESIIKLTTLHEKIPFDFKGDFMNLHFGTNRKRTVTYSEFTQLLHDFHEGTPRLSLQRPAERVC